MKKISIITLCVLLIITGIVAYRILNRQSLILSKELVKQSLQTPSSKFIQWKDAEIHYTDEGEGFPVLMIHGFGGAFTHFDDLAHLMKDKYRIIRVDLPGFGLSEYPSSCDPKAFTKSYEDYLNFFLDTLKLDSLFIIGNSLGGLIAWNAAVQHPEKVKKLVLLSSAGYDMDKVLSPGKILQYDIIQKIVLKGQPLSLTKKVQENAFYKKERVSDGMVLKINQYTNREGVIPHMINVALTKDFPDTSQIKKVKCPTLIIWGREDNVIPVEHAERFHRDIKNSKVIIFEKSGHCSMMEDPKETAEACLHFFENGISP